MAYLSMIVTNLVKAVHGEEGDKMSVPLDFMPDWMKGEEKIKVTEQTQEEMKQIMMAVARGSKKRKPHNRDIQKRAMIKKRKT